MNFSAAYQRINKSNEEVHWGTVIPCRCPGDKPP